MKKSLIAAASCLLAASLMTGTVFAKSDNAGGANKGADASIHGNAGAGGYGVSVKESHEADATVTGSTYGDDGVAGNTNGEDTVTGSTYGGHGHQGYIGLLNAIENVKDKPAGAVIADKLLNDYAANITDEQKAELEGIVEADAALTAAADILEQQGSVTEAVYVEKQAVKANVKNLDSYKKLGELYEKIGKTGVKLYVNGDEPTFEVAPFIRDGNTLVPFRAISEALKADVSWNGDERSVTVTRDGTTVKLYIGSTTAYVNGTAVTLEVPPAIEDGSTVVPVRFVSEALKATVKWEGETQSVVIYEE